MQSKWVLKMVSSLAFTRTAMEYYGVRLDKGIALIADDDEMASLLEMTLCEGFDAVRIEFGRGKNVQPLNYQCGVKVYDLHDKEEKILEFLRETSFLPVVIVGGIVPKFMVQKAYLFRCSASVGEVQFVAELYAQFREWFMKNPQNVQEIIESVKKEKIGQVKNGMEGYISIQKCVVVTCFLWDVTMAILGIPEDERKKEAENYLLNMIRAINNMEEYGEDCDVYDAVRLCIRDSVMKEKYCVVDVKCVQVYNPNTILYDDDYYYIPDKMLQHMCEGILRCVSFLQLKKEMADIGMIKCGEGTKNYTVKKMISLSRERKRFIKIPKDYLLDDTGLGLENYSLMEDKSFEEKELA